jgi:hypothetical protein
MRCLPDVRRDDNKQVNAEVSEEQSGLPHYLATEAGRVCVQTQGTTECLHQYTEG